MKHHFPDPEYKVARKSYDGIIGLIVLIILLAAGAYLYNKQSDEPNNPRSAFAAISANEPDSTLLAKAEQGDKEAQYAVGRFYMRRNDWANAIVWYEKSAAQGYGKAFANLGVAYAEGYSVAKNLDKACEYFQQAHAIMNDQISAANLALCYDQGKKDYQQAFALYMKSAKSGMAQGQRLLGQMYGSGEGTVQNQELAVYWYRQAILQNDAQALFLLATQYLYDQGVPPHANNRKIAYMLMKAAQAKRTADDKDWFDQLKFDERIKNLERTMNAKQQIGKWILEHNLRTESPKKILARIDEFAPYREPNVAELERQTAQQTAALQANSASAIAASSTQ